jgi:hypothetical protein
MDLDTLAKGQEQLNERFDGLLASLNEAGALAPTKQREADRIVKSGVGDGIDKAVATVEKRLFDDEELDVYRQSLKRFNNRELRSHLTKQAHKQGTGVPLIEWLEKGGHTLQAGLEQMQANKLDIDIAKAIDTSAFSAVVRQDLEPGMTELFVRRFPLFDWVPREPANGLIHAYRQQTSYGDADWIGELDTVTDSQGTYVRAFTNIGILATRRGVSLKALFAARQAGNTPNPEDLEQNSAVLAMASRYQKTMLYGNWQDPAGTINNERGPFDEDSFDGLRYHLNTGRAVNVDPATNPDTTGSLRRAFDAAALEVTEAGGADLIAFGASPERITFNEQFDDKVMVILDQNARQITAGVRVPVVQTLEGMVPFYGVPGGFNSSYTATGTYSGNTVRDIYLLADTSISIPYLGSDGPTVIEIPVGANGQLTRLFIVFFMGGLAVKVPTFMNKIRVKVA